MWLQVIEEQTRGLKTEHLWNLPTALQRTALHRIHNSPLYLLPVNSSLLIKNLTDNKRNCKNKKSHDKGSASIRIFNILPIRTRTGSELLPETDLSKPPYKYTAIKWTEQSKATRSKLCYPCFILQQRAEWRKRLMLPSKRGVIFSRVILHHDIPRAEMK